MLDIYGVPNTYNGECIQPSKKHFKCFLEKHLEENHLVFLSFTIKCSRKRYLIVRITIPKAISNMPVIYPQEQIRAAFPFFVSLI